MASPTYYNIGTVTVANGSTSVVGVGTGWAGKVFAGDFFYDPAQPLVPPVRIAADATDSGLTLAVGWPGTGLTTHAYEILITADTTRMQERTRLVLEQLGALLTDSIDDAGQTHKFATAGEKAKLAFLTITGALNLDTLAAAFATAQGDIDATEIVANAAAPQVTTYTKTQTDSLVAGAASGVASRGTVRAASTANLTIATALNNGDTLDGVTLATGDLVLVKDQSSAAENGVYVVGVTPARASEFDSYNEHPGSIVVVQEGTVNADKLFYCTSNKGGTLGTTAISYSAFSLALFPNGQYPFPATQNPSSDANTLDDYEEGSFTPTVIGTGTAGAGTYSVQAGHYVKIGARVFFDITLTWSAHTGTTNMKVSGLPFAAGARDSAVNMSVSNLTFSGALSAYVESGASTIALGTSATGAAFTALAIDTAATLRLSGSYSVI